jgi:hypothetical protein
MISMRKSVQPVPAQQAKLNLSTSQEGPIIVRCAPGLNQITISELKFRKLIPRKFAPATLRQRNHDLIFIHKSQNPRNVPLLHTAEEVHRCLIFGRYKITDSLLEQLARTLLAQRKRFRIVVTADGDHFIRQDLHRWLNKKLKDLGVPLSDEVEEVLWVFCIDENYYVCLRAYNQNDPPFRRQRVEERAGSLPPTIAASLAFLGNPQPSDVVLDPFCGTGTLLAEMNGYAPAARLFGFDLDRDAIKAASKNLAHLPNLKLRIGDGTHTNLPGDSIKLFLSNLPFGKQYGDIKTNPALYGALIEEINRLGINEGWRAVLLTSDIDSLEKVLAAKKNVSCSKRVKIKVRGEWAEIFVLQPSQNH